MLLKCNPRNARSKNRNAFALPCAATALQLLCPSPINVGVFLGLAMGTGHTICILHVPGATIDMPSGRPCLCLVWKAATTGRYSQREREREWEEELEAGKKGLWLYLCWLSCCWSVFSLRYWPGGRQVVLSNHPVCGCTSIQEVCLWPPTLPSQKWPPDKNVCYVDCRQSEECPVQNSTALGLDSTSIALNWIFYLP